MNDDRKRRAMGFNGPVRGIYWMLAILAVLAVGRQEMAAAAILVSAMAIIEAMERLSARER